MVNNGQLWSVKEDGLAVNIATRNPGLQNFRHAFAPGKVANPQLIPCPSIRQALCSIAMHL